MLIGKGFPNHILTNDEVQEIVHESLNTLPVDGKRVLILIPDRTRTMPMPRMFGLFKRMLGPRVAVLDYLVALGTHRQMTDAELGKLVGQSVVNGKSGLSHIFKCFSFVLGITFYRFN